MTDKLREVAQARINAMENPETCAWDEDSYGIWESACLKVWEFNDGGPKENNMTYCYGCGKKIETFYYLDEEDSDGVRQSSCGQS